jgi:Tol biopolymer transport system component
VHAVVDPGAIYSAAPSVGASGLVYEGIASERYALRRQIQTGIQTLAFDGEAFHPAQAEGGSPIYFELVEHRASRIAVYNLATQALATVAGRSGLNASEPAISPDGTSLALVSAGALYLTRGKEPSLVATGTISNPAFFPDGARLVFAVGLPGRRTIAAISATGGPIEKLVGDGDCFEPAVAPNGRLLAFACSTTGARHVWVRNLESGRSLRLTNGLCNNDAPAWDPESRSLVFASDCSRGLGLPALYRIKLPDSW